jgi:hypothetical protein
MVAMTMALVRPHASIAITSAYFNRNSLILRTHRLNRIKTAADVVAHPSVVFPFRYTGVQTR